VKPQLFLTVKVAALVPAAKAAMRRKRTDEAAIDAVFFYMDDCLGGEMVCGVLGGREHAYL